MCGVTNASARSPLELRAELPRLFAHPKQALRQAQRAAFRPSSASLAAAWMRPDQPARLFGTECASTSCTACMTYVGLPLSASVSPNRWGYGSRGAAVCSNGQGKHAEGDTRALFGSHESCATSMIVRIPDPGPPLALMGSFQTTSRDLDPFDPPHHAYTCAVLRCLLGSRTLRKV